MLPNMLQSLRLSGGASSLARCFLGPILSKAPARRSQASPRCNGLYCSLESRPVVSRGVSGTPVSLKCFNVSGNDDFAQKVMNSSVPVIVNFHAEWCEPCHILTPRLKELVGESDCISLAIVDVEANPDLVHTFEVKAVPAVLAIRNGLVIDKFIGLVDSNMIEDLVSKLNPPKQAANN